MIVRRSAPVLEKTGATMYINPANLSLSMAVWLATDEYDRTPKPNVISATELLKPTKSLILTQRIANLKLSYDIDVLTEVPSKIGNAIHAAVEGVWVNDPKIWQLTMSRLDIPKKIIDTVRINPPLPVDPDCYNMFFEQRTERTLHGYTISGKFDIVEQGRVKDIKSTSTYTWIYGGKDTDYIWQGSIYKWLNPKIITDNEMDVEFLFTDWKVMLAAQDKNYPQQSIKTHTLILKSTEETEAFIIAKLDVINKYLNSKENEIPACTPKELWQKPTVWAYFKNPSAQRATKLYNSSLEANTRAGQDGGGGLVKIRPGEVKFCKYCPARPICKQAEQYIQQGLLKL